MNKAYFIYFVVFAFVAGTMTVNAQQITGAWKGKINNQRVELKIIQKGDSLTGTSYYSSLAGGVKRFTIKGYFDPLYNSVVWWDDELITANGAANEGNRFMSVADFNCPGGGRMFLDGKSSRKEAPGDQTGEVGLTKISNPAYRDEWDFVIDNYLTGGNDPYLIDSIARIATVKKTPTPTLAKTQPPTIPTTKEAVVVHERPKTKEPERVKPPVVVAKTPATKPPVQEAITVQKEPAKPPTIEALFIARKRVVAKEIAIEGDSIQLHFYDNAEVDGDSITLYLNNKILLTHLRLTARPHLITIALTDLADTNELVMVAENMGSIPPNTAFMIAMVGGKRHEAFLESTEGSSSVIRFTKLK